MITLFLCGDVMTGRGVDQILPHPGDPQLHEAFVRNARYYVALAESVNGCIQRPVSFDYIWGEALSELDARAPAARIINLETSVTTSDDAAPKGINYRMHPRNVPCLTAAGIDCCVLANNHVLDWGSAGLRETLQVLDNAGLAHAGAGADGTAAASPARLPIGNGGRLLVFAAATGDSGVPPGWAATPANPGVRRLPDLSEQTLRALATTVTAQRRRGDIVLFSLHWGGNWGFEVSATARRFARGLIDRAGVDVVHGHSSHHVKGLEVHRNRLILYGCGDFLNDYEGIGGHDRYRGDLGLMYFPRLDSASGRLQGLDMVPTRIRRMRIERAHGEDRQWLARTMVRECARLGSRVRYGDDGPLTLGP
ncbi:CapA family protein [Arhodomonas sp. AD133]|uniref:CapA family protein n=1 Tax=Arhodomonas sp. AD133 TaxID=3415009 RepID=UPI003EBADC01